MFVKTFDYEPDNEHSRTGRGTKLKSNLKKTIIFNQKINGNGCNDLIEKFTKKREERSRCVGSVRKACNPSYLRMLH